MSKLKLNEVVLTSPNGLVEKSITMGDDGIVKVNGVQVADTVSGTFTPSVTSATGAITSYASYGEYTKIGKSVLVVVSVSIITAGTAGGALTFSGLPFTVGTNYASSTVIGQELNATGELIYGYLIGTTIGGVMKYDRATTIGSGRSYKFMFTYSI